MVPGESVPAPFYSFRPGYRNNNGLLFTSRWIWAIRTGGLPGARLFLAAIDVCCSLDDQFGVVGNAQVLFQDRGQEAGEFGITRLDIEIEGFIILFPFEEFSLFRLLGVVVQVEGRVI